MIRTTYVELRGDRLQADRLSKAHTQRMLHDFRRGNEFQNLLINSTIKEFFDESGKFIGSIYVQTSFGTENVVVTVPLKKELEKKKEEKRDVDVITQIVPIIRSRTNQYWLACLSGTFADPYYCFRNIFEISDDVFYNFDQELEYHNRLISRGDSSINGSIEPPELYLIACSGEIPDEDGDHPDEYEWLNGQTSSAPYTYVGESIWFCGTDFGGYGDTFTGTKEDKTYENLYVFGKNYFDFLYELYTVTNMERTWVLCSLSQADIDETDVISACSGRDITQITPTRFFGFPGDGLEYENQLKTQSGTSYSLWSDNWSIRAERDNTNNSVTCYRLVKSNSTYTNIWAPFNPCESDPGAVENTNTSQTYCDYIKVDGVDFPVRELSGSSFPRFFQRDLRYYNTDRPAATTALVAANKGNIDTNYERWLYYYVGPNSDGELHTTEFFPKSGSIYHIIPNVAGIDDTVTFSGKIFLGMIKYEIER